MPPEALEVCFLCGSQCHGPTRREPADAWISVNSDRVASSLIRMAAHGAALAAVFKQKVTRFQYTVILLV